MTTLDTRSPEDDVAFDLSTTIFSARGSWLNLSPVIGYHNVSDYVHIVSHKTRVNPIFKLVPHDVEGEWTATASKLTWTTAGGSIEFAFQDISRIRVRARNLALTLETVLPRSGDQFSVDSYTDQNDDSIVFTAEETGQRYRIKTIGDSQLTTERLYQAAYRWDTETPSVTLGAAPLAEMLIEEIEGADVSPSQHPSFDDVVAARRAEFAEYLDTIAPFRSGRTPASAWAAYINWATTVSPGGFIRSDTVLMSKHWMDKAWSWDHCFNALALANRGLDGWDQFMRMFDYQVESGQIPDSMAHSEIRYNYAKPPIHGIMLKPLLERLPEPATKEMLTEAYDRLSAWTNWWLTVMTAPGERLAHYYFGNDSGWDNATVFDEFHPMQAPDLNAYLVILEEFLADLADQLGNTESATHWRTKSQETLDALIELLWNGEAFVIRKPKTGETRHTQSLLFAMPIVLGTRLPAEITAALTDTLTSHLTEYGLATEHPESPHYEADGYWRGPIWAPTTYLAWLGLKDSGKDELAAKVSAGFRRMCEREGFAENFDAHSGQGLRDRSYTWTASVYLLLAQAAEAELSDAP